MPDGFVLTDPEKGIVITFERGRFNDTQKITFLEDIEAPDPAVIARSLREMADWLAENHPETLTVNAPDKQAERNRIGLLIRRERERQGLSLRDLAARCGITHSHIARIESGKYNVTLDILSKVAAALGKKVTLE